MNPQGGFDANPVWRVMSFLVTFVCGVAIVWVAGARIVAASGAPRDGMALDFLPQLRDWRAEVLGAKRLRRVAIIGDSMLWPLPGFASLGDRVGVILGRGRGAERAAVYPLSFAASGPITQYCIADEVIRAKPDVVALEANLRAFEPGPLGPFAYSQLAGWIDPSRWTEAALLPMSDADITVNRLLFYGLLARSPLEPSWVFLNDRQARLLNSRDSFEAFIAKKIGGSTVRDVNRAAATVHLWSVATQTPQGIRPTPALLESVLGEVLEGLPIDSPRMQMLAATVRHFHEAGIPTLVWISPINIDFLQSRGLQLDGLEQTIRHMRTIVEANGGVLADFRNLLSDAQFRDWGDHYTVEGDASGTAVVAPRLARMIRRVLPQPGKAPRPPRAPPRAVR